MNDNHTVQAQKTYLSKTAGGWLEFARVLQTRAGEYCVWVGYHQALMDVDGNMVLNNSDIGNMVVLITSTAAHNKLNELLCEADLRTLDAIQETRDYA